ncbi:MAG: NAD-dependent epimerase/dehydratase family protein [Butyrivibrio sp.]|nr:NAD-dependent epimerase/dehydratase family protein [Butyrivibrio sp.]
MPIDKYLLEDLENIAQSSLPFEELYGSTVLVTGATGLVGSQAVKALLTMNRLKNAGIKVIATVRNEEKARRAYEGFDADGLSFLVQDVTEPIDVSVSADYIIHAASPTSSKFFVEKPVETIRTAVNGTDNILSFAARTGAKGMVYLSSMEVYGVTDPALPCVREKDLGYIDILNVRSSYSEGKRICECLCASYAKEYGVPVKTARLAQTFGAGIPYEENRVFAQFAKSAINGTDIVLHTQGNSVDNYCYTRDVIKAVLLLLLRGEAGEAYTVTNEESNTTIRGMAQMVADKIAGGGIRVVFDIPKDALAYGYAPDVKMQLNADKLRALGWEPEIGLLETYERMIGSMLASREEANA